MELIEMRPPVCSRGREGRVLRRDEWMDRGDMVIVRFHLSGLFYYYLLIEYARKDIEVNRSLGEGIEVRVNFLEVWR